MNEQLNSLISNGWEFLIRGEIDKPFSISIWRADWIKLVPPNRLYASRPCQMFRGDDLEMVVAKAYEFMLGVI